MSEEVNRNKSVTSVFPTRGFYKIASLFTIVCLVCLSACSFHTTKTLKSCRYQFRTLTFSGMDAGQTHWLLDVAVANPNPQPITLSRMHFALMHEADTLLTGWNPAKREIASNDSQVIQTTLDLPNALWKRLPSTIWTETDAQFLVTSDAYLDTWVGQIMVPNAVHQTIHVNMQAQMAKYRDLLLQKMFSWPGRRLNEDIAPPKDPNEPTAPDSSL